jgi:cytochrome c peroxidase
MPSAALQLNPGVSLFSTSTLMAVPEEGEMLVGCENGLVIDSDQPATAVTFSGSDVVAQRFVNARLTRFQSGGVVETQLSNTVIEDTGHELFHRDTGGGLACASCHPEGTDDGHVWRFTGLGPRRTQNLAVPLAETAPFHWDGDLPSVASLMDEVFVERMGGAFQSEERLDVLQHWLFTAPKTIRVKDVDAAAERGKVLFESAEVGCSSCHTGKALTDNLSYDVGTALRSRLQVPSLVGLAAHPPFMHDGCAMTLRERFDNEACGGGDLHGRTSQLDTEHVDDLVAYLHTL